MSQSQANLSDYGTAEETEAEATKIEDTLETIQKSVEEDNIPSINSDEFRRKLIENGHEAYLDSSRCACTVRVPNERMAVLWKTMGVQFTDGAFQSTEGEQLKHPFAYADADIEVDPSLEEPVFDGRGTHEEIGSFEEHFEVVPRIKKGYIAPVRYAVQRTDYSSEDLDEDLRRFDSMEIKNLFDIEECSECNPGITPC